MKKCLPLILFISLVAAIIPPATANIRAPYSRQYKGSQEVCSSVPDLKVMGEDLVFSCDYPYKGDLCDVERQKSDVRTSATYTIWSERDTDANFDFISTVARPVEASINGAAAVTADPVMLFEDKEYRGGHIDNSRYRISFSGHLKQGLNTINVCYTQPMSFYESSYGYFTSSKFRTFFTYDLSPLRQWNIDKSFSLNIKVTFKDDSWLKHLFGSSYAVHFFKVKENNIEQKMGDGTTRTRIRREKAEVPIKIKSINNTIEFSHIFHNDFPDMIEASCGE